MTQHIQTPDGRLVEARMCEVAARQALGSLKHADMDLEAGSQPATTGGVGAWGAGNPIARQATAEADAAARRRRERAAKGAAARWAERRASTVSPTTSPLALDCCTFTFAHRADQ